MGVERYRRWVSRVTRVVPNPHGPEPDVSVPRRLGSRDTNAPVADPRNDRRPALVDGMRVRRGGRSGVVEVRDPEVSLNENFPNAPIQSGWVEQGERYQLSLR